MNEEIEEDTRDIETLEEWSLPVESHTQGIFLVKIPEWASESLLAAPEGTVVGHCEEFLIGNILRKNFRFSISDGPAGTGISEFTGLLSSGTNADNLSIIETSDAVAKTYPCGGVFTAVPVRDASYKELVKTRNERSEQEKANKRKTVLDSRPLTEPATHNVQMFKYGGAPGEAVKERSKVKRGVSALKPEELGMSVLVAEDVGWNLNQFARRFKEAGGYGVGLKEVKKILVDICDLVRRGDDHHPKYYLKSEYKVNSKEE